MAVFALRAASVIGAIEVILLDHLLDGTTNNEQMLCEISPTEIPMFLALSANSKTVQAGNLMHDTNHKSEKPLSLFKDCLLPSLRISLTRRKRLRIDFIRSPHLNGETCRDESQFRIAF